MAKEGQEVDNGRAEKPSAVEHAEGTRLSGTPARKSAIRNAPEIVFEDRNGNLFLKGDTNRSQDQHLGKLVMSQQRIEQWQILMRERTHWLGAHGIKFAFMLGPDKQSVYWPSMGFSDPDHRNSLLVFRDLNDVPWIDPVPALAAAPAKPPVYPINDSHYDAGGAYIAYKELMTFLGIPTDRLIKEGEHFDFMTVNAAGDLGNKLIPQKFGPFLRVKRRKMHSKMIYNNGIPGNGGLRILFNPKAEGIAFLCGDSYTQSIYPFISEHFSIIVHLRSPIDKALVLDVMPATVIGMVAERFMLQPPVLDDDLPSEFMFIRKLVNGEISSGDLLKSRLELTNADIPTAICAVVSRNDALSDVLLFPGVETERQRRFSAPPFDGAGTADAVVSAYLAWVGNRPLNEGWEKLYRGTSQAVQEYFDALCPRKN